MLRVNGRRVIAIDAPSVAVWAAGFQDVTVDLRTGDGRFVRRLAEACPTSAAISVDTCQASLRKTSQAAPGNALFLVADALALPGELHGIATHVTVNFPWGSLLRGLVEGDDRLLGGLRSIARAGATLEVALNGGALAELGLPLEPGGDRVADILRHAGLEPGPVCHLSAEQLRRYPTKWAKRLAFGRDPRAIQIRTVFV